MGRIPVATRFKVLERDRFACTYCGRAAPNVELQVDHIIPRAAGGPDSLDNYTTACADCNMGKRDRVLPPPKPADPPPSQGLGGRWFHTLTDRGTARYQGEILRDLGEFVEVELYSWRTGCANGIQTLPHPTKDPDRWILYRTCEAMVANYEDGPLGRLEEQLYEKEARRIELENYLKRRQK